MEHHSNNQAHSITASTTQIKSSCVFLVSMIEHSQTRPLFICDNATFGLSYFNIWKIENGYDSYLSKIEPIARINPIENKDTVTEYIINNVKGV